MRTRRRAWLGGGILLVVLTSASPLVLAQQPTWGSGEPRSDSLPDASDQPERGDADASEPPLATALDAVPDAGVVEPAVLPPAEPTPTAPPRIKLRTNLALDLTVSGVMAASLITWVVAIRPELKRSSCAICDRPNGRVNAVDDFFRTTFMLSHSSSIETISDVFGYGVGPMAGIALAVTIPMRDRRIDEAPENLLLITEATLVFTVLQQGLTVLFPRERPAVHAEVPHTTTHDRSSLESFPGGHNGLGFVIAAAGGTVATMRRYRLAPLVWIVGGAIAFTTTYLRIAADRHYFTDLMSGTALGVGTGIAVPLIFHRPIAESATGGVRFLQRGMFSTTEVPGGRVVALSGSF
jgi:membrane-associated phospholipid phosphatase